MCLATVYEGAKGPSHIICRNITNITVDKERITLTDILGAETLYLGRIVSAELNGGTVILERGGEA